MFDAVKNSVVVRLAVVVGMVTLSCTSNAQAVPAATVPAVVVVSNQVTDHVRPNEVQLGVTFDVGDANLTSTNPFSFLLQGGNAEVAAKVYKGFGGAGSVTGLHTNNSGQGVPVNLLIFAFGPRYTVKKGHGKHPVEFFGEGLVGEADGFDGLYPSAGSASSTASSLALQAGGGIDIQYTPHVSVRIVQADWLRTYLPDSRQNIENTLRLGIGIVFRGATTK